MLSIIYLSVCLSVLDTCSLSLGAQQWLSVVLVQLGKAGKHSDMSEKLLTGTYYMRISRNFGRGGGVQALLPEN